MREAGVGFGVAISPARQRGTLGLPVLGGLPPTTPEPEAELRIVPPPDDVRVGLDPT